MMQSIIRRMKRSETKAIFETGLSPPFDSKADEQGVRLFQTEDASSAPLAVLITAHSFMLRIRDGLSGKKRALSSREAEAKFAGIKLVSFFEFLFVPYFPTSKTTRCSPSLSRQTPIAFNLTHLRLSMTRWLSDRCSLVATNFGPTDPPKLVTASEAQALSQRPKSAFQLDPTANIDTGNHLSTLFQRAISPFKATI
ncbi:hypothetical protein CIHG_03100 [Coccidioides immitis H538.4]|uniref:Uncharacterized protein n=1 Tax=Coccidioides immitis H538.4 TaxID=396776 RepID=A0A0J8RKZ9_COCIT|nr:hypothetical protein CIHG_03100 [Coccidioides immitis H538.4]